MVKKLVTVLPGELSVNTCGLQAPPVLKDSTSAR